MSVADTQAPAESLSLPELLRIMDVATALRQDRELVEQQLNLDELKARLRERLLAGSTVTGEAVTPEEVDAAIDRYFTTQNTFAEPTRNLEVTLAHLYVRRHTLGKWLGLALAALAAVWFLFLWDRGPLSPTGRARRQLASLSSAVDRSRETIRATTDDPEALAELERLDREAELYEGQADRGQLETVRAAMADLEGKLNGEYTVRIVSRPGERSAVVRHKPATEGGGISGYYLFVEAVAPDGTVLPRRISNAEEGTVAEVTQWAERVPSEVYERIRRDKQQDGIVDENVFAVKRKGRLDEEVTLPGPDGQPLERLGQITQW
jgi:hypothetical protein